MKNKKLQLGMYFDLITYKTGTFPPYLPDIWQNVLPTWMVQSQEVSFQLDGKQRGYSHKYVSHWNRWEMKWKIIKANINETEMKERLKRGEMQHCQTDMVMVWNLSL